MKQMKAFSASPLKKLGFGAMRLPIIGGDPGKIDVPEVAKMVDRFIAEGFTYFDTAYPYHLETSEGALKEALVSRYPRDTFQLADKMPVWKVKSKDEFETFFKTQLNRTGAEYFDYYLLHSLDANREKWNRENGAYDYLFKLKAEGRAKRVGVSIHDSPEMLADLLDTHPELDFVQLQINYIDWITQRANELHEVAYSRGIPIIIMEPVKGGMLANPGKEAVERFSALDKNASPASFAIRYAASLPGVAMVLSGMSNMEQLEDNTSFMKDFKPLTPEEDAAVRSAAEDLAKKALVPCTACGYCIECPIGVEIPTIFGYVNDAVRFDSLPRMQTQYTEVMTQSRIADKCIECGACESVCPQHIPIIEELKKAHAMLSK